jgi:hypothetical protein
MKMLYLFLLSKAKPIVNKKTESNESGGSPPVKGALLKSDDKKGTLDTSITEA